MGTKEFSIVVLKIDEGMVIDIGVDLGADGAKAISNGRDGRRAGTTKRVEDYLARGSYRGVKELPNVIGFGKRMVELLGYRVSGGSVDTGVLDLAEDGAGLPTDHSKLHRFGIVVVGSGV
jgi:hypothetical protein